MKKLFRSKLVLAAAVLGGILVSVVNVQTAQAQAIQDCSANSIIKCGVSSPAELVAKARANSPDDLQAVFSKFTVTPANYDAFARDAKMGMANRNGDIVVDGQVVARDAWSIGREAKSYSTPYTIGGKTYHKSKATDVLKQDLPVMVWFDEQGRVSAAILAACGNPMGGTQVTPSFRCNQLKREVVDGQANTYRFSTDAPATNGATISRVVYNFGDGSAEETRTNPADVVTHTYTKSGDFTAKVTVYAKLPGGREVAVNGDGCAQKITVAEQKQAAWKCSNLTATLKSSKDEDYTYTLRANGDFSNARLLRADFDFGDGTRHDGLAVANSKDNNIAVEHNYKPGTYTAKATLYFEAINGATAASGNSNTCEVTFTINKPVVQAAAPVQELPKTGIAGAAGLFAGASVLGTLGYRWRARRHLTQIDNLIDRLRR